MRHFGVSDQGNRYEVVIESATIVEFVIISPRGSDELNNSAPVKESRRAEEIRKTTACADPYARTVAKRFVYLDVHGKTRCVIPNFTHITLDSLLVTFHRLRTSPHGYLYYGLGFNFNMSITQEQ